MFGQKDYQQLRVVTQMARDLDLPLKVVGLATVREKDGLALSSRNVYLTELERRHAPVLYRTMKICAARIKAGEPIEMVLEEGRAQIALAEFDVDYLEARHALTLAPVTSLKDGPVRLLVAAKIGATQADRQFGGVIFLHPPLEGGRERQRAGWGEILLAKNSPHPDCFRFRSAVDPPPPGG